MLLRDDDDDGMSLLCRRSPFTRWFVRPLGVVTSTSGGTTADLLPLLLDVSVVAVVVVVVVVVDEEVAPPRLLRASVLLLVDCCTPRDARVASETTILFEK